MGLGDLGEDKKKESKKQVKKDRAEKIGVDEGEIEDFDEIKERVRQQAKTINMLDKKVSELEESLDSYKAMIEGIFTLMRDDGELVEVIVKEEESETDTESDNPWGAG